MNALRLLGQALVLAALSACAPLTAYRTEAPAVSTLNVGAPPPAPCRLQIAAGDEEPSGDVATECAARIREDSGLYRLYFAEFDDQGWAFPGPSNGTANHATYGAAARQAKILVDDLQSLLQDPQERLSVVVFAHGWKHNARSDDGNVKQFRKLLAELSMVEQAAFAKCPRRVVGVYVGWRGAATTLHDPLESLSFWNRKETAERVAQGDVRVLYARLRTVQDAANHDWIKEVDASYPAVAQGQRPVATEAATVGRMPSPCNKRVRLSFAGHSLGGLIVYTSIAQALIRDVVELGHAAQGASPLGQPARPVMRREGDLVVVVNPAIEGARFEPLYRAARDAGLAQYQLPMFVGVTSINDVATKNAFPIGRWFSTLNDSYPADSPVDQERVNKRTFGHSDEYLTHDLKLLRNPKAAGAPCLNWIENDPITVRLAVERQVRDAFRADLNRTGGNGSMLTERYFCGSQTMVLTAREGWAGNSPVWNIRTEAPIIEDHNDFNNPLLLAVLRQLYIESAENGTTQLP